MGESWLVGTLEKLALGCRGLAQSFESPGARGELQATSAKVCRNKAPILFVLKLTRCPPCVAKEEPLPAREKHRWSRKERA